MQETICFAIWKEPVKGILIIGNILEKKKTKKKKKKKNDQDFIRAVGEKIEAKIFDKSNLILFNIHKSSFHY